MGNILDLQILPNAYKSAQCPFETRTNILPQEGIVRYMRRRSQDYREWASKGGTVENRSRHKPSVRNCCLLRHTNFNTDLATTHTKCSSVD